MSDCPACWGSASGFCLAHRPGLAAQLHREAEAREARKLGQPNLGSDPPVPPVPTPADFARETEARRYWHGPFEEVRRGLERLEAALAALHWLALADRAEWAELLGRCESIRRDVRFLETRSGARVAAQAQSGEALGLEALARDQAKRTPCVFCGRLAPAHPFTYFENANPVTLRPITCEVYAASLPPA
jgi:hypothetical protein